MLLVDLRNILKKPCEINNGQFGHTRVEQNHQRNGKAITQDI